MMMRRFIHSRPSLTSEPRAANRPNHFVAICCFYSAHHQLLHSPKKNDDDGEKKNMRESSKDLSLDLGHVRKHLKQYKHVSPNLSLFESLWLNAFWNFVASFYPKWLAPNLLTSTFFYLPIFPPPFLRYAQMLRYSKRCFLRM